MRFKFPIFLAHFPQRSAIGLLTRHQGALWCSLPVLLPGHFFPYSLTTCCFPTCSSTSPLPPPSSLTSPHLTPPPPSLTPPPPPAPLALHHSTCIQHRSQGAPASSGLCFHAVRTLLHHTAVIFSILLQPNLDYTNKGSKDKPATTPHHPHSPPSPPSILSICLSLRL